MTHKMMIVVAAATTLGSASLAQAQPVAAHHVHHAIHRHVVARDVVQTGRSAYVDPAYVDPAYVDPAYVSPAYVDPVFVAQPYYGSYGSTEWKRHWGF